MSGQLDRISKWVADSSPPSDRFLWVLNKNTQEISWKNRKVYSCWSFGETASLQSIFDEMSHQLSLCHNATSKNEYRDLIKLRERVTLKVGRFYEAHNTFFGFFYKLLFATSLSFYLDDVNRQIDRILSNSLSLVDISTLSQSELDALAKLVERKGIYHALDIDWGALSLDQFKSFCKLEKCAKKKICLDDLSQEKVTYLLEQIPKRIVDFSDKDIEANAAKIEPRFFKNWNFSYKVHFDLSKLSGDQLSTLLQQDNQYLQTYHLKSIRLSILTQAQLTSILKKNPHLLKNFPPKEVADNFSIIEPRFYDQMSEEQFKEIDFSSYTSNQMSHLLKTTPSLIGRLPAKVLNPHLALLDAKLFKELSYTQKKELDLKQMSGQQVLALLKNHLISTYDERLSDLNLNAFTAEVIEELLKKIDINRFDPKTIADNITKFKSEHLKGLSKKQVEALNFAQLTISQLIQIPSTYVTSKLMRVVDLSKFTTSSINQLFESNLGIGQKLSSATIGANISRIDSKHYMKLKDTQLSEIDYQKLNAVQREAFWHFQLDKMKNYSNPKPQFSSYWGQNYFNYNFGNQGTNPFASFFGGFGFGGTTQDDWSRQYFQSNRTQNPQQPAVDLLKPFRKEVDEAIAEIKKTTAPNPNADYEKLRQKFLKQGAALKANPKLLYVENEKDFDPAKLKKYHNKTMLLCHPDKHKDNQAEAKVLFRAACEAFKYFEENK